MAEIKPDKQSIIDIILKGIKKDRPKGKILAEVVKKWQISQRTFDRYWKIAKQQHSELQEKAKEAANEVYIQQTVEAAKEAVMTEIEAKKLMTDLARGNLADYMVIKTVEHTPRVQVPLSEYIASLVKEIEFENEFAEIAGYNEDEMESHEVKQASRQRNVLRHQLQLKKNPFAKITVDGPTEWREVAELDMVKLVRDKEQGKIKSLAHTQHGLKVEMYSAADAATNILKIHNSFPPVRIANTNKDGEDLPLPPQIVVYNSGPPMASNENEIEE